MNAREAAAVAAEELREGGVPEPAFEGELLARSASGLTRAEYFSHGAATPVPEDRFSERLRRRLQREPFAYIHGEREFYGRSFAVGPGVLIPRPETELLVEFVLSELAARPDASIVDVGTGSGAVAVSVAAERPDARVTGTDISPLALAYAAENARRWAHSTHLLCADLLTGFRDADVVVANLPYIPSGEIDALEPEVSRWEPRVALDGGGDGLNLISCLIEQVAMRARPSVLGLEVGFGQAGQVSEAAKARGASIGLLRDLAGIDRVVVARWE